MISVTCASRFRRRSTGRWHSPWASRPAGGWLPSQLVSVSIKGAGRGALHHEDELRRDRGRLANERPKRPDDHAALVALVFEEDGARAGNRAPQRGRDAHVEAAKKIELARRQGGHRHAVLQPGFELRER